MRWRSMHAGRTALFAAVAVIAISAPLRFELSDAGATLAVKSALAQGGSGGDDRGGGDRGGGNRGGGNSGRGGSDGGDRGGGGGDDASAGGDDGGQGRGRGRGGDEADRDDASGDDDGGQGRGRGRGGDDAVSGAAAPDGEASGRGGDDRRPEAVVDLSEDDLAGVLNGRRTLLDDRGRVLEVEIEIEDGRRIVSVKPHGGAARRNPGPISAVRAVDAQSGAVRDVRLGATAAGAAPTARATVRSGDDDPRQLGDDLSRSEEESLIQSGWR